MVIFSYQRSGERGGNIAIKAAMVRLKIRNKFRLGSGNRVREYNPRKIIWAHYQSLDLMAVLTSVAEKR